MFFFKKKNIYFYLFDLHQVLVVACRFFFLGHSDPLVVVLAGSVAVVQA